jgi:hypothetical protein
MGTIRADTIELNNQCIAWFGPFNIKRSCHRVATRRSLIPVLIPATSINRCCDNRIAIGDVQRWWVGANCVVVAGWMKVVNGHGLLSSQSNVLL